MSDNRGEKKVTRRGFLKGAVAGAGVAAMAGLAPSRASAATTAVVRKWDHETDVLILGLGGAGAAAAIEAHDAGARVLVLEKQAKATHYSNTRMAGGLFHSPDPYRRSGGAQGLRKGHVQR